MELHHLLFEHIMPFWEVAIHKPKERFPKTLGLIDKMSKITASEGEDVKKWEKKARLMRDQIDEGIRAGYEEIKKLYQTLLRAPMVFLATLDPKVGPDILRAILAVVEDEGLNIDAADNYHESDTGDKVNESKTLEWGVYKSDDREEWTEEQKTWYEWLRVDSASLAHWYQQIGLCRGVVLGDLKNLSREMYSEDSERQPNSTTRLRDFYNKYPALFVAYRAVFGLLPSASRIVESAHGIVCQVYDPQVSAGNLNAKMRYKMGINYELAEERRKYVREIRARREEADGEPAKKKHKASDNDRKKTQQMEGEQLIKLCQEYTEEKFRTVPSNVRQRMSIGKINRRGSKDVEKKLKREKEEYSSCLREKRVESRDDKDLDEFRELAAEKTTEHAKLWPMKAQREQNAIMHEMLTKTWWNKVPARSFSDEVLRVIPFMEGHSEDIVNKRKTEIMSATHVFGKHLKEVKAAAKESAKKSDNPKKKEKNEVNGEDLTGKKEHKILKKFVKFESSQHHTSSQSARQVEQNKLDKIFKLFSKVELAQQTRFYSEMAYDKTIQEREDEDDEDDDNDDFNTIEND